MIGFLDVALAYWLYWLCILSTTIILLKGRQTLITWMSSMLPERKSWIMLALTMGVVSAALLTWVPFRPRTQGDESLYLSMAHNMAINSLSGSCEEGIFKEGTLDCFTELHLFKGKIFSFTLSLVLPYFDQPAHAVICIQMILWISAWIFIFLAVHVWTRNQLLALLTTTILLSQPLILQLFGAGGSEPLCMVLGALSLFLLRFAVERPSINSFLLLSISLALWIQTRQETLFVLPAYALILFTHSQTRRHFKELIAGSLTLFFFALPIFISLYYFHDFNLQSGDLPVRGHFWENIRIASTAMFEAPYQPAFILLGLSGWITLATQSLHSRVHRHLLLFTTLSLLPALVIFEHISGDLTIVSNHRYAITWHPYFAFWIAQMLTTVLQTFFPAKSFYSLALNLGIALLILTMGHDILKEDKPYNTQLYLFEHQLLRRNLANGLLDSQGLFLYANSSYLVGDHISSLFLGSVVRPDTDHYRNMVNEWPGPKYLVWSSECYQKPDYHKKVSCLDVRPFCYEILANLKVEQTLKLKYLTIIQFEHLNIP